MDFKTLNIEHISLGLHNFLETYKGRGIVRFGVCKDREVLKVLSSFYFEMFPQLK